LCDQAITDIESACKNIEGEADFKRLDTLYYASVKEDLEKITKEYEYLNKNGFQVEFWDKDQINQHYPFSKEGAIYYKNDAIVNPMKLAYGLLDYASKNGVQIYENTEITGKKLEKDVATFFTSSGHKIKANQVIFSCGYEGLDFKQEKNAVMTSSFAVITTPVTDFSTWYNQTLIWESARPYIYMRTTPDQRVIIGGLDENTPYASDRDPKITHKRDQLIEEFNRLFPSISVTPEYYIGAFYGGTHDGLPIIGQYEEFPNCHFILAFGDNGTVYGMALSKIVTDMITKGNNPNYPLYLNHRPLFS
jgi:glycine/D-amino acid oxidase-like deaminating enzyme